MRLDWLERVLRAALEPRGFEVRVAPGAATRGRPFTRLVAWLIDHHTASNRHAGPSPALRICMYGRPGLAGPLCQVHDGRDGVTTVVATGRANHAGYGRCPDGTNPNDTGIGRESENDGIGEPWPARQREAHVIGDAAILTHLGRDASHARGHREVDPRRKIDPTYDMADHRRRIHAVQHGTPPRPTPPPVPQEDIMATRQELEDLLDEKLASIARKPAAVRDRSDNKVWIVSAAGRWHARDRDVINALVFIGAVTLDSKGQIPVVDHDQIVGIPVLTVTA